MRILDPAMERKMSRLMQQSNNCYTLEDIMSEIEKGTMQSHVLGEETWVITQVHEYPQRKAVNITFVVGHRAEFLKNLPTLDVWAKEIGADLMTAIGRRGWERVIPPEWRNMGYIYSKDLRDE